VSTSYDGFARHRAVPRRTGGGDKRTSLYEWLNGQSRVSSPLFKRTRPGSLRLGCHGAPGIGLARLSSLSDGDEIARTEIESALDATVAAGVGYTHCLCHVDPGNLKLLIEAARRPLWSAWRSEAEHLAAVVLTDIVHNGWRGGLSLDVQSPGLTTGLAGIGYQLLRLANPERVPSVLVFNHVGVNEISDGNGSHFFHHSAAFAGLPHAL
jgi:hypothetical protein